jgi:hypothetical protein
MACRVEIFGRKESRFFQMIEKALIELSMGQRLMGYGERTLIVEVIE